MAYVRRTSLRYVSIPFFIHLYIRIAKILVIVLDSSGFKNFKNRSPFNKFFNVF